jgi:outer membrane protein OmpA-like peptidoglycan-associated protein
VINFSYGQKSAKANYNEALFLMEDEAYEKAILVWNDLLEAEKNNPVYFYYTGICHLNIRKSKAEAKHFLELAVDDIRKSPKDSDVPLDAFVYLGISHRITYAKNGYELDKSLQIFNELRQLIEKNNISDDKLTGFLEREEAITNNAINFINNPVDFEVRNMGDIINSEYSEHSTVFSEDENAIYFTSKRPKDKNDIKDALNNEDIFVTYLDENYRFQEPERLSSPINSDKSHEAAISISPDGSKLYFFRDGASGKKHGEGSVFSSEFSKDNKSWSNPELFRNDFSKKSRETHIACSDNLKYVFFTSNNGNGYGGEDIYSMTKLPDGSWSAPVILPANINTMYDEETPFIHPDGKTLYFSSKGHNSMGGFDIFMSEILGDNEYSDPVNLGYPINTPDDEVSFVLNFEGSHGYLSSIRHEGKGDLDLYEFFPTGVYENSLLIYETEIFVNGEKYSNASITIKNAQTGEMVGLYNADESGNYVFPLNLAEEALITYKAEGFEEVNVKYTPDDSEAIAFRKNYNPLLFAPVYLERDKNAPEHAAASDNKEEPKEIIAETKKEIVIKNILFDFDYSSINSEFYPNLGTLLNYLKNNPDAKIELVGYADSRGTDEYNMELSLRRASAVNDYLVKGGANPANIKISNYGENNPVVSNATVDGEDDPEGRKYNRRVDIIVFQQGEKETLRIEQLKP